MKPGAVRIGIDMSEAAPLQHVAFLNEDGAIALIAMNETDAEIGFTAELDGEFAQYVLPAHSIATLLFNS